MGNPSWIGLANCWRNVATPLRPDRTDAAWAQEVIDTVAARAPAPDVLLLGVTPELARLRFPPAARLLAVDSSPEMIRRVWPAPDSCTALAVCGRWQALPVRAGSIDLVLADGSFCVVPDVTAIRAVLSRVATAMRVGAGLSVRTFVRPDEPESLDRVVDELRAGRVGSVHVAKWRVAMALQGRGESVALVDVWRVFERLLPGLRQIATSTGWSADALATLEAYRGSSSRLSFPTLAETRALFGQHFEECSCRMPAYELGERCPTFLWRRR